MHYSVVIPAYNEEQTIKHAIQETWRVLSKLDQKSEIIIVNDGSSDKTNKEVEVCRSHLPKDCLKIIDLPINQGKGNAVRAGCLAAQGSYIAFLDADLATHPRELIKGFALLKKSDIAIASRRVPEASIAKPQPWHRSLAGQFFNLVLRIWTGLPYRDTQCGCKVFRREVIATLFQNLKTTGWSFDVEILYHAKKLGYKIQEFPVEWKNGPITRVRWGDATTILKELWNVKRIGS